MKREVGEEQHVPRLQRRHHASQPLGQWRPLVRSEEATAPAMAHEAERVRRLVGAVERAQPRTAGQGERVAELTGQSSTAPLASSTGTKGAHAARRRSGSCFLSRYCIRKKAWS